MHGRGFVYMFPYKEMQSLNSSVFTPIKQITQIVFNKERRMRHAFPAFVGHFEPEKSDVQICVELFSGCAQGIFAKILLAPSP